MEKICLKKNKTKRNILENILIQNNTITADIFIDLITKKVRSELFYNVYF